MNQTSSVSVPAKRSGCCLFSCGGCLGLGCLSIVGFFALIAFGVYYTTQVGLPNLVIAYTTGSPGMEAPPPSQESLDRARTKLSALFRGITGRGNTATEEFTKDEVPALFTILSNHPSGASLPRLQIKDGKLHLGFSFPLKKVEEFVPLLAGNFPELRDRYVVGDLDFLPEMVGGSLKINITNVNLNGSTLSVLVLRQVNRIINSLLTELSANVPFDSPMESSQRKISLNSITGIELKGDSLKITLSAKERPFEIPPPPQHNAPHQQ